MNAGQIFVAGKWQADAVGRDYHADQPGQRGADQPRSARATSATSTCAVAAARKAFDEGPWPKMCPARARPHRLEARRPDPAEPRRDGQAREPLTPARRCSTRARSRSPSRPRSSATTRAGPPRSTARRSRCATTPSPSRCASRSAWSAPSCPGTSRSCSRPGSSRPALAAGNTVVHQARLADAAHRAAVRRALPGGRRARGRLQRRDRARRQGRHGAGARPARGQDRLHRLDRGRQADHARGGRAR